MTPHILCIINNLGVCWRCSTFSDLDNCLLIISTIIKLEKHLMVKNRFRKPDGRSISREIIVIFTRCENFCLILWSWILNWISCGRPLKAWSASRAWFSKIIAPDNQSYSRAVKTSNEQKRSRFPVVYALFLNYAVGAEFAKLKLDF